ncbi:ATP-grasp domain-containing protein [Micromonosporaceae bacterium Da 78-11]
MRVALVTSERLPEDHWRDIDAGPLTAGLARLGVQVEQKPWDSADDDWTSYDVLVMQSPWSMWLRMDDFRSWLAARDGQGCRMLNPADVVRLGSDKRYLHGLAEAGVTTVPTSLFEQTATADDLRRGILAAFPPAVAHRRTVVVKPVSSGGALGIREFPVDRVDAAVEHAQALIGTGSAAIVQPYVEAIDRYRELAVVVLNGRISHAITKAAILRPGEARRAFHPDPRPYDLTPGQATVVLRAYQAFLGLRVPGKPAVFAVRLDFLIDPGVAPGLSLLEVEAVAPVKFLPMFPHRVPDFAAAIVELGKGIPGR